jgi:hypothetical protein
MAVEEGITGKRRGKHYKRILIFSVLCFLIGIWLVIFPLLGFPFSGASEGRLWVDFLALAGGAIMMVLGFSLWRGGIS